MSKFKNTPRTEAGRIARKAADVIELRGWVKETEEDDAGALCVRGAIAFAYSGSSQAWGTDRGPISTTCEMLADWLATDAAKEAAKRRKSRELSADAWNDGYYMSGFRKDAASEKSVETWRFPPPTEAHEVVAILRKFADEMDPQR